MKRLGFKPENAADASDYVVEECPLRVARELVAAEHYAKGSSNTGWAHCLKRKSTGEVVGAAIWLPPTKVTQESVAKWRAARILEPFARVGKVPPEAALLAAWEASDYRSVASLSRLVVKPGEPKNAAGLLLGRAIKLLQPRWRTLVTYADTRRGHEGVVYKATNWTFVGKTKGDPVWLDEDGRQVSRKATTSRTAQEMRDLGYRNAGRWPKLKFIFARR